MAEYRLDIVGSAEGLLTGLNNAQDALQELSTEAVATGKATQAAFANTGGIEKMQTSLKDQFILLGRAEVELQKYKSALQSAFEPKTVEALGAKIKQTDNAIKGFKTSIDKLDSSSTSLGQRLTENKKILADMAALSLQNTKAYKDLSRVTNILEQDFLKTSKGANTLIGQLRQNKDELNRMSIAGLETSERFEELSIATNKLQDRINDTNERIKFLASDTRGIEGLIGVTKLATAGFAIGQGAAALFGAENENVQKALLKVNAAMAILAGLQEIQAGLQKTAAGRITIELALQKLKIFFLGSETAATQGLTTAQIVGAKAAKALRFALASIGIGLLIAGIAYLIANFDELKDAFSGVSTEARGMARATEQARIASDKALKSFELEERQLRALGAAEKDIAGQRLKNLKDNSAARSAEIQAQERLLKGMEAEAAKNIGRAAIPALLGLAVSQEDVKEQKAKLEELKTQRQEVGVQILEVIKSERDRLTEAEKEALDTQKDNAEKAAEIAKKKTDAILAQEARQDQLAYERAKLANQNLKNLMKDEEVDQDAIDKEILTNKIKFLDDLEKIALLNKDIEFEQGNKSIAETRRIAEEKLAIEIDFAQRRLDLLIAEGGDSGQIKALQLAVEKGKNQLEELAKDGTNENFLKAIGLGEITPEQLEGLKENLQIVADSIKSIFSDLLDGAIESNKGILSNLDEQISKVQDNIEKQKQLENEGRGNNLAAERENLERLQEERNKALERQKQLQKQKLAIDAAAQISSLITATANIFKAYSELPFVGQVLSIAAVAAMYAAFAASQISARKAINQQTLGRGGPVGGRPHDSDGWGGNRYVSDNGDETYIERDEYIVNKKSTKKYRALIEAINSDNLQQMLNGTGVQLSDEKIEAHKLLKSEFADAQVIHNRNLSGQSENPTEKLRKDFNEFRNEQKSKPNITYQNGYRIEIRGNRTIRTKLNGN